MDYYLSRAAVVATALFVLFFIAGITSVGLIAKHGMDTETAKVRNPDFKVRGMALRNVALVAGVLATGYLLYFGLIDSIFYGLMSIAALAAIVAMSQAMNSIGNYALATEGEWRRIKGKSFFHAALAMAFLYFMDFALNLI